MCKKVSVLSRYKKSSRKVCSITKSLKSQTKVWKLATLMYLQLVTLIIPYDGSFNYCSFTYKVCSLLNLSFDYLQADFSKKILALLLMWIKIWYSYNIITIYSIIYSICERLFIFEDNSGATPQSTDTLNDEECNHLRVGLIVVGLVAVVLLCTLVVIVLCIFKRRLVYCVHQK